jgi:hypothetical protein
LAGRKLAIVEGASSGSLGSASHAADGSWFDAALTIAAVTVSAGPISMTPPRIL